MRSMTSGLALLVCWGLSSPLEAQAAGPTHTTTINGRTFTLPVGFTIELVAGPPEVQRPIAACFDEQGILYVTESSGSNEKVEIQLEKKPHRILRLADTKGNGRFDSVSVFAEGLMLPEGILARDGALLVSAPPSIWKLSDPAGTGRATERSEWLKAQTLTNCANDLHGPYPGPDGWIYWCKGAFARQTIDRPGRKPLITRAAHVFRSRPDGTGQEAVMNGGMDNPVDVVFTPGGERIFTTTFFQHPESGRRDGLVHAVYGGVYGKDHEVIHDHPWTAPALMPVLTHLGPAAPSGLHCLQSASLGAEYQNNLLVALFNLRKVTRHRLIPEGATFRTEDDDFLVCDHMDFHPTDVIEDADGSLLVIDTGGWYKLCCPTSQFIKPDILGAIYRIRRTNAPVVKDPRGMKIDWKSGRTTDLVRWLDDPRPTVRQRAQETLARRGGNVIPILARRLEPDNSPEARRNVLWTACRIDDPAARELIRKGLVDPDAEVRQVALHAISLWRDARAVPGLIEILGNSNRHNRRAAAEALGRIGSAEALPALLRALDDPKNDRVLEHSLTYALLEIGRSDPLLQALSTGTPRLQRNLLMALDQMTATNSPAINPESSLPAERVVPALASADSALRETATWIVQHHPEWGGALVEHFRGLLKQKRTPAQDEELAGLLGRLAGSHEIQDLLKTASSPDDPQAAHTALLAMTRSGLRNVPPGWYEAIQSVLSKDIPGLALDGLQAARILPAPNPVPPPWRQALQRQTEVREERQRLIALTILAGLPGNDRLPKPLFQLALDRLERNQPAQLRSLAAEVLSRYPLDEGQLVRLAEALPSASPLDLARLLEAFARSRDQSAGLKLFSMLRKPELRASLRLDQLPPLVKNQGPEVQKEANLLKQELEMAHREERTRLERLFQELKEGDVRRGQRIFHQSRAACASCHKIGYVGGSIGPDLSRIGSIRDRRDLLESILFPSSSFTRSYEPISITTLQGQTYNGLIKKDGSDEVILTLGVDREIRIPRDSIEEMRPGQVSIMPTGLDSQLSPQDLADLLAFLAACR